MAEHYEFAMYVPGEEIYDVGGLRTPRLVARVLMKPRHVTAGTFHGMVGT